MDAVTSQGQAASKVVTHLIQFYLENGSSMFL
jgi:hypothetical protein